MTRSGSKHRSSTWTNNKRGKGGKTQIDGSRHSMGNLLNDYHSFPSAAVDKGDPNYAGDEDVFSLNAGELYDLFDDFNDDEPNWGVNDNDAEPISRDANNSKTQNDSAVTDAHQSFDLFSIVSEAVNQFQTLISKVFDDPLLQTYRKAVEAKLLLIYSEHRPEKAANVKMLMQIYKGKEDKLLEEVRAKYCRDTKGEGKEVIKGRGKSYEEADVKSELERLYTKHRPEKYELIGTFLTVYKGREQELLREVQAKYCNSEPIETAEVQACP